ncbi:MAG: hypothetical protein ACRDCE_04600 [Cetobacterium sp.]|uniref:hypothetical protein n=1 Tax=Cetobacterium sp. TaxID=2071632 RepID=UPI003EE4D03D
MSIIKKRWAAHEIALFDGTMNLVEIAEATGRTYCSVSKYYCKNKKRRNLTARQAEVKLEIMELVNQGYSRADIIEQTGASPNYVSKVKSQMGHGKPYKEYSQEEDEFIKREYGVMKAKDIAAALGREKSGINARIHRMLKSGELERRIRVKVEKPKVKRTPVVKIAKAKLGFYCPKQEQFIIDNYGKEKQMYIAYYIGKSEKSLQLKIKKLKAAGRL